MKTAIYGIPLKSGEVEDTIAEFPLAERSVAESMNRINVTGQSKAVVKPNFEGTQVLLRTLLKEDKSKGPLGWAYNIQIIYNH